MRPRYACFYLHQNLRLGWLRDQSGNNLALVLPDGQRVRQRAGNVLFRWLGRETDGSAEAAQAQLREEAGRLAPPPEALETLYGRMEPGRPYDLETLACWALPGAADGWQRAGLFVGLLEDKRRFRYSTGRFIARGADEVAERTRRLAEEAERERWIDKARRWREGLEQGRWDGAGDPEAERFLAQLRSLLAKEKQSPYWPLLAKPLNLFHLHSLDLEGHLKGWLQTADAWPGWPAIWLTWGDVPQRFPAELEAAAERLAATPVDTAGRTDYRDRTTYTVDSANTLDCDDAVSVLEADGDALTIALHIAEPSWLLGPEHPLFEEASRRMYSVYTPGAVYPMLPTVLSNRRFSLLAGADRETVSFVLRLAAGEAELLSVERSVVRVARNLDYESGEALLLEEPETWGRLARACGELCERRIQRGAVVQERREVWLDVSDPEHIRIGELLRNRPVHQFVEELAILHNSQAGLYCDRHGLPAIYRVQPRPRWKATYWSEGGEGLQAARFTTEPEEHAGLGCERYSQTTSPIRRFADLVMQRQIVQHATGGRPAFPDPESLMAWAERADGRLASTADVAQRIESHWKRRYLAQHPGLEMDAVVRRHGDREPNRVWLEPVQLTAACGLPPDAQDGDRVRVRVDTVELDKRIVWVACL